MNKYLIITTFVFISVISFAQNIKSDTISVCVSSNIIFQYRLSVDNIDNSYSASSIKDIMKEYFHSDVIFNESLKQFIFVSDKELTQVEIAKNFDINVSYFKKLSLNKSSQ